MIGEGFIGIRGKDSSPESGLWIQDLEGVNIALAANTADEEVVQGVELLRRIEEFSQKKLIKDFLFKLSKYLQFQGTTHSQRSGYINEDYSVLSLSGYVGLEISRVCPDRFSNIHIEYVEFMATKETEKILFIQDGPFQPIERVISVKQGLNKIRVDYTAQNDTVRVFLNICDFGLFDTTAGCCEECPALLIKGVENYPLWEDSGDHNGMIVTTSIKGNDEEVINLCREQLYFPALYAYGAGLMKHILRSRRVNPMIRNSEEDAKQNLIHWMGGFSEDTQKDEKGEYWRCLGQAVEQSRRNLQGVLTDVLVCNNYRVLDSIP